MGHSEEEKASVAGKHAVVVLLEEKVGMETCLAGEVLAQTGSAAAKRLLDGCCFLSVLLDFELAGDSEGTWP